ncbi:MAG: hypothetical protein MI724_20805 [Spirochaetales bacterium]|nr:hypothetical protein [Spirochaetales bacterium]
MWAVARFLFAVFIGSIAALVLPRSIGGEIRLFVPWDLRLTPSGSATFDPSAVGEFGAVAVETSTMLALVEPTTGRVVASVPRGESVAVSENAYISQTSSASNWTVRNWHGEIVMIVPNVGLPRIDGDVLLQFAPDGTITAHHLARRWRRTMDPAADLTVYGVLSSDSAAFVGRGTLRGELEIASMVDRRVWRHRFDFPYFSGAVPTVYGLQLTPVLELPDRNADSLVAEIAVIRGLNPQMISIGALDLQDDVLLYLDYEVPPEMAVRWPTGIVTLEDGRTIVGLAGGFAVAQPTGGGIAFHRLPGAVGIDGVSVSADDKVVMSFPYIRGTAVAVGDARIHRVYTVAFPGLRSRAVIDRPDDSGLFVMERDDLLLAVEVRR